MDKFNKNISKPCIYAEESSLDKLILECQVEDFLSETDTECGENCSWYELEGRNEKILRIDVIKPCKHFRTKYYDWGEFGGHQKVLDCQVESLLLVDEDDECGVNCSRYEQEE